jgi:uncharacterized membrane protein YhaH (DUF805 family)
MTRLFGLLFGLRTRVPRTPYITAGLSLAVLKFGLDFALVRAFTGTSWSPLGYLVPSVLLRETSEGPAPAAMYVLLAVGAMPFLWVGLSMSVRRAADAGLSPWFGVLFVVPLVNYAIIAALSLLPSKRDAAWHAPARLGAARTSHDARPALSASVRAALLGLLGSIALGLAMLWLSVYGLQLYGAALFFATPFAMGTVSAAVYNRDAQRGLLATLALALVGTAMTGSIVLLFALEGVICLAMAFPIAAAISLAGALVAWAIAAGVRDTPRRPASAAFLFILPLLAFGESRVETPTLRHVTTHIEIDSPPEAVWPHVIGFSELPAPPEWFFRLGVAYPQRARIEGAGVGAVRHCEFSTGPFVEPITVWEPPRRLAFDVTAQPPSMSELSPYHRVNAPHLEGYMVSRGGEFRLVPLPGGRTRLEGTTHYTLAIYPETYWVGFAEVLLHAIHWRVLSHIRALSEVG